MATFTSDMAWSTKTDIYVKGRNLSELMGSLDLGGMLFLLLTGREPSAGEARMTNAMLVALVEHGMTPSALATRLTWLGAPENLQGAVASGLLGVGSRFVGPVDEVARLLQETVSGLRREDGEGLSREDVALYRPAADTIVSDFRSRRAIIPGIGHPIHDPEDPRTLRLFGLAEELDLSGPHVSLQRAIREAANDAYGRHFPINVTGAIGAIISDMGFPWQIARGFPVVSRCVGLIGHLREETERPLARTLWDEVEARVERPS